MISLYKKIVENQKYDRDDYRLNPAVKNLEDKLKKKQEENK